MGAEIDRLEIEIEAQATKANNALDKLVGKLERLAGSLGSINGNSLSGLSAGINDLGKSMQGMKNVGTADFTRLAKNISQIGSIDTAGINKTASAINRISASLGQPEAVINGAAAIGNLAKGIAKLGNKSTLNAIDNMPKLATALNSMMNTLSKAPTVSSNLINMTTALAGLANQGSKVGSSAQSVTNGLNGYSASTQRASKSSKGLASIFGRLYANFFWVKRGADKLWQSIETSMDYVETLNYFDAAFGQVAESAVSQWESAGYDSADAYYKSFSDRAKELTSKMSGFRINENGTLTATGQTSLGIDPEKMMNYQATFGQMASSMGVASETSLKLSQALTEIGADLASVKNLDFDKVWNDMASGLAGMSRTLDKYGVNIRNVNLQQKLNELGIQANITAMNQNDKALLRAIILLENTKYAWGDLAETINQPANQLRLIESNFQNLSRTIGNLFLPMVSKVLPYVNAMVIALQRLATWIGNLLGIDLSKVTSSVADSSFDFGSIADEAEEATGAVNKLQKSIRKFDELNVISSPSESSSGSGGGLSSGLLDDAFDKAYSEYQKAWDDAFNNMENRAQKLADKIEEFFAPVKNIFSDFFEGDFFAAGQDTSNLVAGILNWFADGIDNVPWYEIGQKIGDYLAGINWTEVLKTAGRVIWEGINASTEFWSGLFNAAPIETSIITAISLLKWTGLGKAFAESLFGAATSLDFVEIFSKLYVSPEMLSHLLVSLEDRYLRGTWLDTDTWTGIFADINNVINDFISGCGDIFITNLFDAIMNTISINWELYDAVGFFFGKLGEDFKKQDWGAIGEDILGGIISGLTGAFYTISSPFIIFFDWIYQGICDIFGIHSPATEMYPLGENILLGIVEGFFNAIPTFTEVITSLFDNSVKPWFTKEKWDQILSTIPDSFESVFSSAIKGAKDILQPFLAWIEDVFGYVSNGVSDIKKMNTNSGGASFKRTQIPQFETGGYVPTRFTTFIAGENGIPEMLGTVGGKTAVAGGAEITGIRDAVFTTAQQEIELLRQQNQLLRELVNKKWGITQDEIGESARRYAREEYRRTGNNIFIS